MASQIQQSSDLWDFEHFILTQRRKEIDRKYHYRYSRLTQMFGILLYQNRLSEEELRGEQGLQAEGDSFFRQIPSGGRGLTCILSAIAWLHQQTLCGPASDASALDSDSRRVNIHPIAALRMSSSSFGRSCAPSALQSNATPTPESGK